MQSRGGFPPFIWSPEKERLSYVKTRDTVRSYCLSFRANRFRVLKFGKTKQIVVTFVATTLKTLFSVAKTNVRLSGCQLYAGNIDYFLLNVLAHISPYQHIKKVRPNKGTHRKSVPSLLSHNLFSALADMRKKETPFTKDSFR